jgi:hypothetical protein
VTPLRPRLRIVSDEPTERVFGSARFIGMTRNTALKPPAKFQATVKGEGDVVI